MTIQDKLARLQNRSTAYEVVLENRTTNDVRLVRYASRHSFRGMWAVIRDAAETITAITETRDARTEGSGVRAAVVIGSWQVRFSGRTQLEAIIEGERPFIGRDNS